jgi:hypothetical protein
MDATVRLIGLEVGDEPAAWRAAGFAVGDDGRLVLDGVVILLRGASGPRGVLGWALQPASDDDLDGLPARPAPPTGDDRVPDHPNGATVIDHVVVTSDDVERTTPALSEAGIVPRRSVVGARGDGDDDLVYRFFLLGTCVLELVGPARRGEPDTTSRAGARFAGLALTTTAIDELGEVAGTPRAAVQPGRRIATLRTRERDISVPIAMLTPRPPQGR